MCVSLRKGQKKAPDGQKRCLEVVKIQLVGTLGTQGCNLCDPNFNLPPVKHYVSTILPPSQMAKCENLICKELCCETTDQTQTSNLIRFVEPNLLESFFDLQSWTADQ